MQKPQIPTDFGLLRVNSTVYTFLLSTFTSLLAQFNPWPRLLVQEHHQCTIARVSSLLNLSEMIPFPLTNLSLLRGHHMKSANYSAYLQKRKQSLWQLAWPQEWRGIICWFVFVEKINQDLVWTRGKRCEDLNNKWCKLDWLQKQMSDDLFLF